MKKETAEEISQLSLKAIECLSKMLYLEKDYPKYEAIRKGVGISIGRIQTEILEMVYKEYPDIDPDK